MLLPARLLTFAACGLAGYLAANAFGPSVGSRGGPSSQVATAPTALQPLDGIPEESAMVAEWEQLRRDHGGDGADLPALYAAIKETKDPYRRRAFRAALIAEWATREPGAALAYLLEKDGANVVQFMREWMRIDPNAAITGLLARGTKASGSLRSLLGDIAQSAPGRLAEVVTALPKPESRWDRSTEDAFGVFAQSDLTAARVAAESITGPMRGQALAGVAKAWAEKDGAAALAWAEGMPAGEARDAALRGALIGWAKTDPVAALDKLDLAPPGGDEMSYASDVGAQVLREAAGRNWDATMKWLIDHPGKLGSSSFNGIQEALSKRLVKDTGATLREIMDGRLPGLAHVFGNSVLNEGYVARDAIWSWLDAQPKNAQTQGMRGSLLNAMGWKEPAVALEFLEKLSDTPEDRQLLERGTQALLNGGSQMHLIEDLLEKASPKVRPFLVESGLHFGSEALAANPERWIARLKELPADRQLNAVPGFARAWASRDPEAAVDWAMRLPDPAQKTNALNAAAGAWAQADPHEAAAWVNTLPAGGSRDGAAQALVHALARQQPETAWSWALSIQAPGSKMSALQSVYQTMRSKDPAIAEQMLQNSDLPSEQIKALKAIPTVVEGRFQRTF